MNDMYTGVLQEKQKFRDFFNEYRKNLSATAKRGMDVEIIVRLLSADCYNSAKTVLTYVSLDSEIDTMGFIRAALANGKRVACPRCGDATGQMDFYFIDGTEQLQKGAFGVLEPTGRQMVDKIFYDQSICIVPGLGFDAAGHRLGYGQGFYDRFLSEYTGVKIGLAYSGCVKYTLPHESFDVPVDYIITESYVRKIKK